MSRQLPSRTPVPLQTLEISRIKKRDPRDPIPEASSSEHSSNTQVRSNSPVSTFGQCARRCSHSTDVGKHQWPFQAVINSHTTTCGLRSTSTNTSSGNSNNNLREFSSKPCSRVSRGNLGITVARAAMVVLASSNSTSSIGILTTRAVLATS